MKRTSLQIHQVHIIEISIRRQVAISSCCHARPNVFKFKFKLTFSMLFFSGEIITFACMILGLSIRVLSFRRQFGTIERNSHRYCSSFSETDKIGTQKGELNPGSALYHNDFYFRVLKTCADSMARNGVIGTPHGVIETPNFVFCATKAAMKAMTPDQLRAEGTQIILSNTYHLMLTPGSELVANMGGLQRFTGWKGPMLTDSGGYQIFSMGFGSVSSEIKGKRNLTTWDRTLLKIDEEGATFRSYVDGSIHNLTPEKSINIQRQLGADLIVVLDECTPFNVDKDYTAESMRRSHRWALRSLNEFRRTNTGTQALYGIIQGGIYEDLRVESVNFVNNEDFFGIAIGGSLGATKHDMHQIVAFTRKHIRNDRPIHLLGIGGVRDIFHGVRLGIDTFDCVHPSRLGRHGGALVLASHWDEEPHESEVIPAYLEQTKVKLEQRHRRNEIDYERRKEEAMRRGLPAPPPPLKLQNSRLSRFLKELEMRKHRQGPVREHVDISNSRMRADPRPIDATCECYTCKNFSRAYIHHLIKAKESTGGTLVTIHNVHFMNRLMRDIREGIRTGTLDEVERRYVHPELKLSLDSPDVSKGMGV